MLADFSGRRVLVVGDVMLDRYLHGHSSRISPEAPVPVVSIQAIDERGGGAANVAANVAALAAHATLVGLVGGDSEGQTLKRLLAQPSPQSQCQSQLQVNLIVSDRSRTTVKSRVLGKGQQLLRLDSEAQAYTPADLARLFDVYLGCLDAADVVVLSDYAKGALQQVQQFIAAARKAHKPVFVDPKQKDFACYRHASVLTPNYGEFQAVVGHCADLSDLEKRALKLKDELALEALLVTRGEHGMSLVQDAHSVYHINAPAQEVYDVTGAGDTVIATLATAYASGASLIEAVRIANRAAALVVAKSGTATVRYDELRYALQHAAHGGVVHDLPTLLTQLESLRNDGKRIVMTNGCFDILHGGHIACLKQAAALGDCLVVAVNDDASVRRLKGAGRPINRLQDRLELLAALRMVDWVIAFSEPTPLALIEAISPHILAKGGDYQAQQVVGYEQLKARGGKVVILDYREGFSTTELLKQSAEAH